MAPAVGLPSADVARRPGPGFSSATASTAADLPAGAAGLAATVGSPAGVGALPAAAAATLPPCPRSTELGRGDVLLRRLAADAVAAAAAGAGVAPVVTIIDRSIVRNAAGVEKLWSSVASGLRQLLLQPLRFAAGRDFRIVLGVYVGTYAAANGAESLALCSSSSTGSSTSSAGIVKFAAATAANMYLCIRKDIIFAKLFGRKAITPATTFERSSNSSSNGSRVDTFRNSSGSGNSSGCQSSCEAVGSKGVSGGKGGTAAAAASPANKVGQDSTSRIVSESTAAAASSFAAPAAASGPAAAVAPGAAVRVSDLRAPASRAAVTSGSPAARAAGETETPRRFPLVSTLLFVARDSLTIAASFNAPPYVAAWLSRREKRIAARGGGGGSEAVEQQELPQPSRQQRQQQEQQQQFAEHRQQRGEEEQKQKTQDRGDRKRSSAHEEDATFGRKELQQWRPVVFRQHGGDSRSNVATAADVVAREEPAAADAPAGATTGSRAEAPAAGRQGRSAAAAGTPRTGTAGGDIAAAAAGDDIERGAAAATLARNEVEIRKNDEQQGVRKQVLQQQNPSAMALSAAQLLCPVAIQFLSTPLHLLSLDFFNNPCHSAARRCSFLLQTYSSTVAARVARILPAFGVGGIVNNYTRGLLQQQLHVDHLSADVPAAAG